MTALSLLELNTLVRQTIERTLNREYWVEAELSECRESRGHCYMELIQYDDCNTQLLKGICNPRTPNTPRTPVARAQAKCWRSQWLMLQPMFERTTGQQLHAGMKVRLKVYAQFHEAYGFSWIVTDIDPTFTLGDMARRRQEIIARLKAEGVFDMQKSLELPLFCLRVAVVSSATAAGYGDFEGQLADSPFAFRTQLFPAMMQGEQVEQSIIAALNRIYEASSASPFDCVVIIRGGGATADLSGFDTLALAENVAQFPLPIITGIGHDRDESILDMVSHTRVKTPTAAAALLIAHAQAVLDVIDDAQTRIAHYAKQRLVAYHSSLNTLEETLPRIFTVVKARHEARLDGLHSRLLNLAQLKLTHQTSQLSTLNSQIPLLLDRRMLSEHHRLQLIEEKVKSLDPALLLRRGYSITLKDGHALRDAAAVGQGDKIETRLANGTIRSTVE